MVRSEPVPEGIFPESMLRLTGRLCRFRCLSTKSKREVYLVEDSSGHLRIFKVRRDLDAAALARFELVRHQLAKLPGCNHLLPILAHDTEPRAGLAWEELALADSVEAGEFDHYSPLGLEVQGILEPEQTLRQTIEVAHSVLQALEFLHTHRLIHGDLKPSNILRLNRQWVVADFDALGPAESIPEVSASTDGFQPPDGGMGKDRDTYALGKVLYEIWSGHSRLEYPALPARLLTNQRWNIRDGLLNELVLALCAPASGTRLTRLDSIRKILDALVKGDDGTITKASRSLRPRRSLAFYAGAAVLMAAAVAAWVYIRPFAPPRCPAAKASVSGYPLSFTLYRDRAEANNGFITQTSEGILAYNSQALLVQPLLAGDHLDIVFRKEAERGHVGFYLSDSPMFQRNPAAFSHQSGFGGLDHLLFVHLDGETLVPPSLLSNGVPMLLPAANYRQGIGTNALLNLRITLDLGTDKIRWKLAHSNDELAQGWSSYSHRPTYLNFYVFEDTTCLLKTISISKLTRENQAKTQPLP